MFLCHKCNKGFKTNQILGNHLNKKKPCDKIIIFKCDNCLKVFNTTQHLNRHLNRKNKCVKKSLEQEIIELKRKLELSEEKQRTTIINNHQTINNINTQINIFSPEGKLYHTYFLKSKNLEQLDFDISKLDKLTISDYTDELSNIYNFTNLIKEVCFNIKTPDNWIMCKDELFKTLKLKIDNDNIVNCQDNLLNLIYTIAKQIVEYDGLDIELYLFYKSFISNYKNNEYKDNNKLNTFIKECNEELFKHQEELLDIIEKRRTEHKIKKIEELDINNFGEEDIRFIKKSILDMELNSILEKQYPEKVYNNSCIVNEFRYYGIMDVKMIDMFIYFLRIIYNNDEQICNKTIQYKEDKFYIYRNSGWVVMKSKDLVNQIFTKIHLILKLNKIKLIEGVYTEDYCIETFKEKYTIHYTIGDVKKYSKILIEYFKDNHIFDDHEKHII